LGPEGGRPGIGLHRQLDSGKLGIVKILRYIRSDMYTGRKIPPLGNGALCLSTPKHSGKSGTDVALNNNNLSLTVVSTDILCCSEFVIFVSFFFSFGVLVIPRILC